MQVKAKSGLSRTSFHLGFRFFAFSFELFADRYTVKITAYVLRTALKRL